MRELIAMSALFSVAVLWLVAVFVRSNEAPEYGSTVTSIPLWPAAFEWFPGVNDLRVQRSVTVMLS